MDSALPYHAARALLEMQIEFGVTEAICDAPVDRFALAAKTVQAPRETSPAIVQPEIVTATDGGDAVAEAEAMAAAAGSLSALNEALSKFEHCALKRGARSLVFSDGDPAAPVMIIGEAPGRDEDIEGRPFVGRAGRLLDNMLAAIGHGRDMGNVYITNVLPWRPPQNRDPSPEEIAMLRPFVARHVALADPAVLILMGNASCQAGLGKRGITRLRGNWQQAYGKPALPMFHPAYLLRNPAAKREAWQDLLSLGRKLKEMA